MIIVKHVKLYSPAITTPHQSFTWCGTIVAAHAVTDLRGDMMETDVCTKCSAAICAGTLPTPLDVSPTLCAGCGQPAHASETDDDGVGECCAAWVVEWSDGGSERHGSYDEAATAVRAKHRTAFAVDDDSGVWGLVYVGGGNITAVATVRRAVRS